MTPLSSGQTLDLQNTGPTIESAGRGVLALCMESDSRLPKVIFVVGSTGVGKSNFAVWLATQLNGEIISADSMQVTTTLIARSILAFLCSPTNCQKLPDKVCPIT